MNLSDENILKRFNDGDEASFESVFHAFYPPLCYFANKIIDDNDVARDLVQELFVTLYHKKYKFDNLVMLRAFLYKSIRNRAFNYVEKRSYRKISIQKMSIDPVIEESDLKLYEVETDLFAQIFTAIDELPEVSRRVFQMSYLENMDVKSISKQLGIAASSIMTHRQRAKNTLREKLKDVDLSILLLFSIY